MNTSIRDFASEEFVMSSYTISLAIQRFHLPALVGLVIFLFSGMVMSQEKGTPESPVRTSVTKHYVTGGRYNPRPTSETTDELAPLQSIGTRSKQDTRGGYSKIGSGSTQSESGSFDFWFYDADVVLFNDDDRDGYYHGVDLLFDIDTNFASADIYAVMYLSLEGGPWNEYAATDDFTIFGASSSDEYVVVTELMSGYPTGSYDLLIEIFDSFDGTYLGSFGVSCLLKNVLPKAVLMKQGLTSVPFVQETLADLHNRLHELEHHTVDMCMNTEARTVSPDTPLVETLLILYNNRDSLPVVDPDSGKLVGFISYWAAGEKILSA